jgi:hypothetical protein
VRSEITRALTRSGKSWLDEMILFGGHFGISQQFKEAES